MSMVKLAVIHSLGIRLESTFSGVFCSDSIINGRNVQFY